MQTAGTPSSVTIDLATVMNAAGYLLVAIAAAYLQRQKSKKENAKDEEAGDDLVERLVKEVQARIVAENTVKELSEKTRYSTKPCPIVYIEPYIDDQISVKEQFNSVGIANEIVIMDGPEKAYEYLRKNEVVLVIVGIRKGQSDPRIIKVLKEDQDLKDVPVIVLSSITGEETSLYRDGAMCFIEKPFRIYEFLKCLNRHGFYWGLMREKTS